MQSVRKPSIDIKSHRVVCNRSDSRVLEGYRVSPKLIVESFREPRGLSEQAALSRLFTVDEHRCVNHILVGQPDPASMPNCQAKPAAADPLALVADVFQAFSPNWNTHLG